MILGAEIAASLLDVAPTRIELGVSHLRTKTPVFVLEKSRSLQAGKQFAGMCALQKKLRFSDL